MALKSELGLRPYCLYKTQQITCEECGMVGGRWATYHVICAQYMHTFRMVITLSPV